MSESTLRRLGPYVCSSVEEREQWMRDNAEQSGKENEEKKDGADEKKEEDDELGEETEEERAARKAREAEERRQFEEEERLDRERRALLEKKLLADLFGEETTCCNPECGTALGFHRCDCLAPVRQDPIPYDDLLEKRKLMHPDWYVDPFGLDGDDMAAKMLRLLMGEFTEEETQKLLEDLMKEEKEEEEPETDTPPEPLSRASTPGSYDFSHDEDEEENSEEEDEEEEDDFPWPTCREFTIDNGRGAIQDFIETKWEIPQHWKFCVDFLGNVLGPPEQMVEDFYYRAKFSVPTRKEPIPLQRAAVHFVISVMLHPDRPRQEKVYVAYYLESKRTRYSTDTPFKIEWLQRIMETKHRLADDWGRRKTNLYQYVLDGPEQKDREWPKAPEPVPTGDTGRWIIDY